MRKYLPFLVALLVGGLAHAALTDSYGASRVGKVRVECPDDPAQPCLVTVARVRFLTAQAQAEAAAAGIQVAPIREEPVQRNATRALINQFLTNTTALP